MKKKWLISIVSAVVVVGATIVVLRMGAHDDTEMRAALIGHWRAVDRNDDSLHHHREGVVGESVVFKADGTLVYQVVPKPGQGEPRNDPYSWEVVKGRLQLRFLGSGSTQDTLPRLRISVDDSRLSMNLRGNSKKEFERVVE